MYQLYYHGNIDRWESGPEDLGLFQRKEYAEFTIKWLIKRKGYKNNFQIMFLPGYGFDDIKQWIKNALTNQQYWEMQKALSDKVNETRRIRKITYIDRSYLEIFINTGDRKHLKRKYLKYG